MNKAFFWILIAMFAVVVGAAFAFVPTPELNEKIDQAADKIVELVESKPEGFADYLLSLFTFYHDMLENQWNEQWVYVIETLEAWLINYLSHDEPMIIENEEWWEDDPEMTEKESICTNFGWLWIGDHNECEGISADDCAEVGGTFNECASACRHEPEGTLCTLQCVIVCEFPDQIETSENEIDLSMCESYFDGCNTCMVEDGEVTACTKKYCMENEEPKCLKWKDPTPEELANCESWFDGCNTCSVENGEITACTEMACMEYEEPKCVKFGEMEY